MRCSECEGKLKVTNVYATPAAKLKRVECLCCGAVGTVMDVLINMNPDYGQGAHAIAQKILSGEPIQKAIDKPMAD